MSAVPRQTDAVLREFRAMLEEIDDSRRSLGAQNATITELQREYERKLTKLHKRYLRKIQRARLDI